MRPPVRFHFKRLVMIRTLLLVFCLQSTAVFAQFVPDKPLQKFIKENFRHVTYSDKDSVVEYKVRTVEVIDRFFDMLNSTYDPVITVDIIGPNLYKSYAYYDQNEQLVFLLWSYVDKPREVLQIVPAE